MNLITFNRITLNQHLFIFVIVVGIRDLFERSITYKSCAYCGRTWRIPIICHFLDVNCALMLTFIRISLISIVIKNGAEKLVSCGAPIFSCSLVEKHVITWLSLLIAGLIFLKGEKDPMIGVGTVSFQHCIFYWLWG